ncbi:hypothetical protein [Mucilaginibacter sp.]|uniref:hypothetical protein n=1 Tax=Mucilaginibacter sp. TaxID=1882438 RepID=UPI00262F9563|nr:hypothetical protein [Mucilaginibacter sp.]MDB5029853.1 hypothetical protein [Mucilaginibacter sp.]
MNNQTIEYQAKEYLFDLNNIANENGFKSEEGWELSMATADEKKAIEKKYYPTVSTSVLPEIVAAFLTLVKTKLATVKAKFHNATEHDAARNKQLQFLVAYNPNRLRR